MNYITCKCGNDNFVRIVAVRNDKANPKVLVDERGLMCSKCKTFKSKEEVERELKGA